MAIRIVLPKCDGIQTTNGAKVFDDETGVELAHVSRVVLDMGVDDFVEAHVTMLVSRIEYADE